MNQRTTTKRSQTNWTRIDALKDREIDTSDIPEQKKAFFKRAVLRIPEPKTAVTIRLDRQVLDWFKAKGPGYQTRINALLRAYMEGCSSRCRRQRATKNGKRLLRISGTGRWSWPNCRRSGPTA